MDKVRAPRTQRAPIAGSRPGVDARVGLVTHRFPVARTLYFFPSLSHVARAERPFSPPPALRLSSSMRAGTCWGALPASSRSSCCRDSTVRDTHTASTAPSRCRVKENLRGGLTRETRYDDGVLAGKPKGRCVSPVTRHGLRSHGVRTGRRNGSWVQWAVRRVGSGVVFIEERAWGREHFCFF
jgi:hypothetical protein